MRSIKFAKDIHEKYIDPPNTTDFGPCSYCRRFICRSSTSTRDDHYATPITKLRNQLTTLAAMLNSLQMGFKTLAIQKRSEVWKILGAVKTEFGKWWRTRKGAKENY